MTTQDTLALTQALVERPSITPDDQGCQTLIADRLKKLGFTIEFLNFEGVTNLWAKLNVPHPTADTKTLVLAGHTDVVPTGDVSKWTSAPFTPTLSNGYLIGRGVADMKGGLAAMITACERLLKQQPIKNLKHNLAFLITSDEEGPSLHGTRAVLEVLKERNEIPAWCLVGEPSCEQKIGDIIKIGRRGSLTGFLTVYGKQGHVAYPHLAKNPIHPTIDFLKDLLNIQWPTSEAIFPPTGIQIVNIQAGTGATNVIPGQIDLNFNIRFAPPLKLNDAQAILENVLSNKLKKLGFEYDIRWHSVGDPFYTQPDSVLIQSLIRAIKKHQGITPTCCTKGGTSDGRFFAEYGTEVAELGLINESIHQIDEKTPIEDLAKLSNIYQTVLEQVLCE